MDAAEEQVLEAIRAEPGLHPREYAQRVHLSYMEATEAARRLVAAELVIRTGQTVATRYWPSQPSGPITGLRDALQEEEQRRDDDRDGDTHE
jgi:hypothetical protein